MNGSGTQRAIAQADSARLALETLARELDLLATELDRAAQSAADAARCITHAEEARGAARLLAEWKGHLRRLRVPGVDAE
ncbi:hypothetical protein EOM89_11170 [Candidatus Falkowbacteria bacterium]|nr:hypothetical protein [Candidatus Falkowbacteria bacterium]